MSGPVDALAAFSRAARGRRWYLFGARAVALLGRDRATRDVDVTVSVEEAELPGFLRALEAEGFRSRAGDLLSLARATFVLPVTHTPTGTPVDVVLARTGLEARFFGRTVSRRIGSLDVAVLSPEDLVVTKLLAARPLDLEDARSVVVAQGDRLDRAYVRATLAEIEAELDASGLVAAFEGFARR
ncbi:MAG: DUF6036 family nucleotidyltransferase [Myxococcota bacterium]